VDDIAAREWPAFVVSHPLNIRYLSGFAGSTGLMVVTAGAACLLTDGRYHEAVRDGLADGSLGPVTLDPVDRRYDQALAACLGRIGVDRAAFEAGHVTVATLDRWQRAAPAVEWIPAENTIEARRAVKDAWEIEALRRSARTLSSVAAGIADWVAAGRTERDVAQRIDRALADAGFSAPAFPTIVASGPNSARPHARPTERAIAAGDLVLLDFGGVLDGYCSDLTRMAAVGQPAAAQRTLYEAVREAHRAALAVVAPGVKAASVDRAARQALEARGYGAAFVHSTGHGLGLEVHEAPRLARVADDEPGQEPGDALDWLAAGMVCTIEPGAYVEGLGGVRVEDDVLVTVDGCEVLTTAPRDLVIV
jgi:Xaa-Pro aminopeptidase